MSSHHSPIRNRKTYAATLANLLTENFERSNITFLTWQGATPIEYLDPSGKYPIVIHIGGRTTFGDVCQTLLFSAWTGQFHRKLRFEYYMIYQEVRRHYMNHLKKVGIVVNE